MQRVYLVPDTLFYDVVGTIRAMAKWANTEELKSDMKRLADRLDAVPEPVTVGTVDELAESEGEEARV